MTACSGRNCEQHRRKTVTTSSDGQSERIVCNRALGTCHRLVVSLDKANHRRALTRGQDCGQELTTACPEQWYLATLQLWLQCAASSTSQGISSLQNDPIESALCDLYAGSEGPD